MQGELNKTAGMKMESGLVWSGLGTTLREESWREERDAMQRALHRVWYYVPGDAGKGEGVRGRAAGGTPYMTCYDASADTI